MWRGLLWHTERNLVPDSYGEHDWECMKTWSKRWLHYHPETKHEPSKFPKLHWGISGQSWIAHQSINDRIRMKYCSILDFTSLMFVLSRMKKKFKEPRWWSILAPGTKGAGVILIPNFGFAWEEKKYGGFLTGFSFGRQDLSWPGVASTDWVGVGTDCTSSSRNISSLSSKRQTDHKIRIMECIWVLCFTHRLLCPFS